MPIDDLNIETEGLYEELSEYAGHSSHQRFTLYGRYHREQCQKSATVVNKFDNACFIPEAVPYKNEYGYIKFLQSLS